MDKALIPENCIIVGNKDIRDYIVVLTKVQKKHDDIVVLSRGKNISKAVDLSLLASNCFDYKIVKMDARTVALPDKNNPQNSVNISEISIYLRNGNRKR